MMGIITISPRKREEREELISCTFACPPGKLPDGAETALDAVLARLAQQGSDFRFYIGGTGEFGALCARAVRKMRAERPQLHIRLLLVAAQEDRSLRVAKKWLLELYDGIVVPPGMNSAHPIAALQQCGRWMIDHSDVLITHGPNDSDLQKYAAKKGLQVYTIQ